MDWQAALRARALAASPITALVGTRVTWVDRPQASALPAITFQTISDLRPQHLQGFDGLNVARVQVDCWAASYAKASEVAEAAIAALVPSHSGNGIRFSRAFVEGKRDLGETIATQFIHRVSMDLMVHYSVYEILTLSALTLDTPTVAEDVAIGTLVATLIGTTAGSTVTLGDDAGGLFALVNLGGGAWGIETAGELDFGTAASHEIEASETHADASNSPRDSVISITVTAGQCWPQPEFDASAGLTLTRCTVSGGQLHFLGSEGLVQRCSATSLRTLTPGDYYYELSAASAENGPYSISIGGTAQTIATGGGLKSGTITTAASNQIIQVNDTPGNLLADFNSLTVHRV